MVLQQVVALGSGGITLAFVVAEYLRMRAGGMSSTSKAKRLDLRVLLAFADPILGTDCAFGALTISFFEQFRDSRLKIEKPSTVKRRLATLADLCRWAYEEYGLKNRFKGLRNPIVPAPTPHWFTDEELTRLRSTKISKTENEQLRDKIIFELGALSGLRVQEIKTVTVGQLDLSASVLRQVRRKGNRYQDIYIHPVLVELLQAYLPLRERILAEHNGYENYMTDAERGAYPLIVSSNQSKPGIPASFQIGNKTIWQIIHDLGVAAHCPNCHPHRLRHSFVRKIYKATNDLRLTSEVAGHSSPATTMRYTVPDENEQREAIKKL